MTQARRPQPPLRTTNRPAPAWSARRPRETRTAGGAQALGAIVAVVTALLVAAHGLALATAPAAAGRTLRATLPALTDLDQTLAAHADEIAKSASGADASVPVPGLPMTIAVPRQSAAQGGDTLREAALDGLVGRVYAQGHAAFRAPDATEHSSPALFSSQWALWRTLGLLTGPSHHRLTLAALGLAVLALVSAALLALRVDSERRGVAAGSAVAAGALLAALGALLARLVVWLFASDPSDIASTVVGRAAHDLTMTVVVTAAVAGAGGILLAVVGAITARMFAAPVRPHASQPQPARRPRLARDPREER